MVSYSKVPSVMALTRVVLPAYWSPTMAIYSYLLKKAPLIQSSILLKNPNIFAIIINIISDLRYYYTNGPLRMINKL